MKGFPVRVLRPVILCTIIVGVALTLALGPSLLTAGQAGAQVGYGSFGPSGIGSDTVPPRELAILTGDQGAGLSPLVVVVLAVIALLVAGLIWAIATGRIHISRSES
jgi:hypothetical protein